MGRENMGSGYSYTCKKCKCEYRVHPGIGMGFPRVYQRKLAEISAGEYGPELQELYNKTPYAAINAEYVVYICDRCGTWEVGIDLSLYAPDDPDSLAQKQYGIKTVAEWGHVPYVMPGDLKNEYHLVKRHYHRCNICGNRMHKASPSELRNLPCPECGAPNQAEDTLFWD